MAYAKNIIQVRAKLESPCLKKYIYVVRHGVPEGSVVDKHLDRFAHFLIPLIALKITDGFRFYLI